MNENNEQKFGDVFKNNILWKSISNEYITDI